MSKKSKQHTVNKPLRRSILTLMPIQAMAVGLPAINIFITSIIIGNTLGTEALAAIGFCAPVKSVMAAVSTIIAMGSQLLCGNCLGRGDENGIRSTFSTGLALCVLSGIVMTLILIAFPDRIALLLGAEGNLAVMAADYLRGQALGTIFIIMSTTLIPFLQFDQAKAVSTASVVVLVAVNIICNFLNAGVFRLGMYGAGVSIALANALSCLVALFYFAFKRGIFKFSFASLSLGNAGRILKFGAPNAISSICLAIRDGVTNQVLFDLGGTLAVSVYSVASNIFSSVGCTIEGGYTGSASLLSSVLAGERDIDGLRELPATLIETGGPVLAAAYAGVFIFARQLSLLFGAAPENIGMYIIGVRIANLWYLTNIIKTPTLAIYRGLGMTKTVSIFCLLNDLVFPMFTLLILTRIFGINAAYAVTVIPEILLIISFILYFRIKMGKFPDSLRNITYIPRSFGISKDNLLVEKVHNAKDAVIASQKLIDFCNEKGMSREKSFHCGLALEEMAVTVINAGFNKKTARTYQIDIRAINEDNQIRITMRDNCDKFDPDAWLKLYNDPNPHVGTSAKVLWKITEDINYKNTLGLNVLSMVISK